MKRENIANPHLRTKDGEADLLDRFRVARYEILKDAEGFLAGARCLEWVGQLVDEKLGNGLNNQWGALKKLLISLPNDEMEKAHRLFHVVKDARNDAVHQGAWARHMAQHMVQLFLLFEEALLLKLMKRTDLFVADVMVTSPVIAEPWQLMTHVRSAMLANSFSYLPVKVKRGVRNKWMLLSDSAVLEWIYLKGDIKDDRKDQLSMRLSAALDMGLRLEATRSIAHDRKLEDLLPKLKGHSRPVLLKKGRNLVGLVTAFDII